MDLSTALRIAPQLEPAYRVLTFRRAAQTTDGLGHAALERRIARDTLTELRDIDPDRVINSKNADDLMAQAVSRR